MAVDKILKQAGDDEWLKTSILKWNERIQQSGLVVSVRTDTEISTYNNEEKKILISIHKDAVKGEGVLWNLLHEYGHHLDSNLEGQGRTPREYRAWRIAEKLLEEDGGLKDKTNSFKSHEKEMLLSYQYYDVLRGKSYAKRGGKGKAIIDLINGDQILGNIENIDNKKTFSFKKHNGEEVIYSISEVLNVYKDISSNR